MLNIILIAAVGAALGYFNAHKIAGGVQKEVGAAGGGIIGLLIGIFLKPILWIAILAAVAVGGYYIWKKYGKSQA